MSLKRSATTLPALLFIFLALLMTVKPATADPPEPVRALYLAHRFDEKTIGSFLHYAEQLGINAAVLHVKDPQGRLYWNSKNQLAREIGAVHRPWSLPTALKRLKKSGIWTIAKLDIFADDLLAAKRPELAIQTVNGSLPWKDKNGLHWTNPHHPQVRKYILELSQELIALGFDEIQFDYIRFPSDGDLNTIKYPVKTFATKSSAISSFLAEAAATIRTSALFSVDLFGMVAWKKDCFGIGQVLEEIAPHVDVICPMLYPSHFPPHFLGWEHPEAHPREIMRLSLARMRKRTTTAIRPWIQGFWYGPEEVNAQLDGTGDAGIKEWMVWNPAGRYRPTYEALGTRYGKQLTEPSLYPRLAELRQQTERVVRGLKKIVNYTNYREGYSILSLDDPGTSRRSSYLTPAGMLNTLDEGIMDHILRMRKIPFNKWTTRASKRILLARLMSEDLEILPTRMRAMPIYIEWSGECTFSTTPPGERLSLYRIVMDRRS